MRRRLVVLASGSGTNLQAILDACTTDVLAADVAAVVSDQPTAFAATRAESADVPAIRLPREPGEARADYDTRLAEAIAPFQPDWIVLAGWMRLLSMKFLGQFPDRVVNLHPARPGELAGPNSIERAFEEFLRGERTSTGVMVHLVPDEGIDDGPVLATLDVPIAAHDTVESLAARVHAAEHKLLVATLRDLITETLPPKTP